LSTSGFDKLVPAHRVYSLFVMPNAKNDLNILNSLMMSNVCTCSFK